MPAKASKYAENTTVSVDRSQEEAKRLLRKYGADQIQVTEDSDRTVLMFRLSGWVIRFMVTAPDPGEECVSQTRTGGYRPMDQRAGARQREYQRRFRTLILRLKAKLEAVANDDILVEEEMLGNLVVNPQGQTVGELLIPQLEEIRRTGKLPELMPQVSDRALPPYRSVEP